MMIDTQHWYIRKEGVIHGPASVSDLKALLEAKRITLQQEASQTQEGPWRPLGNYTEFAPVRPIAELFGAEEVSQAPRPITELLPATKTEAPSLSRPSCTQEAEDELGRFEKLSVSRFSALGCGIGLVSVAFVAFGFIFSTQIFGKIVGLVVLIFCLTMVAVWVWFTRRNDPLLIGEDYVAFEGKKIYARDVVKVEVEENKVRLNDQYYPLMISTNHGIEIINLLGYAIKPDRVGQVADGIAECLKTRIRP